jgi:steroid delta-isomerase-like uncharacterized protein
MRKLLISALVAGVLAMPVAALASESKNEATAARVLLEKMGQGRFEISDEIYGPNFVAHGFGRDYSLDEDNASGKLLREAFPDMKVTVERSVADGDLVAVHWRSTATNTVKAGPFPGNGRTATIDGMTFFRFDKGRIVEEWTTYDNLSMMKQLDMLGTK